MSSEAHRHDDHHEQTDEFKLGYHVGPFGRWARLIFATDYFVFFIVNPILLKPVPQAEWLALFGTTALWVLVLTAIYFVTFYFVGELLLSKMNPWTGTIIFLGTPSVIFMMGWMPQPIAIAFGVYVYLSLMLIFYMRYGGCEVVALPSFILGKRYTMYCPYNAMDAVERGVTPEGKGSSMAIVSLLSMTITLFVGSYFIFIHSGGIGRAYGITFDLDGRWALLMLFPFLHLGFRGIKAYMENGRILSPGVLKYGFGALALFAFILSFAFQAVSMHYFWLSAMSLGGLWVLFEIFRMATGGRKTGADAARQGE